MSMFKKVLALLAVVALLAAVPVATSAEEAPVDPFADLFDEVVLHSYTIAERPTDTTGNGLAFKITLNITGAKVTKANMYDTENPAQYGDYTVASMGAVLTNQVADASPDKLTIEEALKQADDEGRTTVKVGAKFLCDLTDDTCTFAARIIRIPDEQKGTAIFCRPYCILNKVDGEGNVLSTQTVYADSIDVSSFNKELYRAEPELTPVLDLSTVGNVDDKITVSASPAEYVAINENYKEGFKVSLTLSNTSANAISSNGDSVTYSFKDKEGNEIGSQTVAIDVMNPGDTKDVEFYAPIATTTIEQSEANLNYVPDITLPAIGSDIDVTKKKNRIRVSAASAAFNEDGTIAVSLTFKNYTSNWITEETDYIQYTYYNAAGTKIKTVTLYIGCIDTKKNPSKTFTFDVPATAASVKITKSKIVYWTEWA